MATIASWCRVDQRPFALLDAGRFDKTGMSDRQFCTRCGGHLMVHHPGLGLASVFPAVVPTVDFRPVVHLNYADTGQCQRKIRLRRLGRAPTLAA